MKPHARLLNCTCKIDINFGTLDVVHRQRIQVSTMNQAAYDQDLYTWSLQQAQLLRERKFDQVDWEHIIEEVEDMSKSEKRALQAFLETLLMHLLKWQYQPAYQGNSWRFTIIEQRQRIVGHLQENPGLSSKLPELIDKAYGYAITSAVRETGLSINHFPSDCPWSFDVFMNDAFWPEPTTFSSIRNDS